jgi:hypothetical protein
MPAQTTLKRIRLTAARSKEFPEGSSQFGYEFIAPTDYEGRLDAAAWKRDRADCTVRHFAEGKHDTTGMLVHKAGEHGRWVFDYDFAEDSDDEAGYLFGSHVFMPGEYVTIRNGEGDDQTFKVATVEELAAAR